jgi:hypothetical protein
MASSRSSPDGLPGESMAIDLRRRSRSPGSGATVVTLANGCFFSLLTCRRLSAGTADHRLSIASRLISKPGMRGGITVRLL